MARARRSRAWPLALIAPCRLMPSGSLPDRASCLGTTPRGMQRQTACREGAAAGAGWGAAGMPRAAAAGWPAVPSVLPAVTLLLLASPGTLRGCSHQQHTADSRPERRVAARLSGLVRLGLASFLGATPVSRTVAGRGRRQRRRPVWEGGEGVRWEGSLQQQGRGGSAASSSCAPRKPCAPSPHAPAQGRQSRAGPASRCQPRTPARLRS